MNEEQKKFLDEEYKKIAGLSTREINQLLTGLPPLETTQMFSVAIQDEDKSNVTLFDSDLLYYRLKKALADSCKIEFQKVREYQREYDLSKEQATALLVVRNQFLCNLFAEEGQENYFSSFYKQMENYLNKISEKITKEVVEAWRLSESYRGDPALIPFGQLPRLIEMKKTHVQSQSNGRRVGSIKKYSEIEFKKKRNETGGLLAAAINKILSKNPEAYITQELVGKQIIRVKKSVKVSGKSQPAQISQYKVGQAKKEEGEVLIKSGVTRALISLWLDQYHLDLIKIESACRDLLRT